MNEQRRIGGERGGDGWKNRRMNEIQGMNGMEWCSLLRMNKHSGGMFEGCMTINYNEGMARLQRQCRCGAMMLLMMIDDVTATSTDRGRVR